MDTLLQDLRYGLRALVKNPGFAALTMVCLALGIGVNTMMFSVVDSIVRPLPFADPDRLIAIHEAQPSNGIDLGGVWYQNLQDFKAQSRSVTEMAGYTGRSLTFADTAEPERVNGENAVSQRTQEIGVRMALGASRGSVFALIVSQGAKLAGAGIALGALGAFGITRVVSSLLYNVSATDPISFIVTGLFLTVVALLATDVPARRATGVDPMVALRAE